MAGSQPKESGEKAEYGFAYPVNIQSNLTSTLLLQMIYAKEKKDIFVLVKMNIFRVEILHLKNEYRSPDEESCDRELDRFLHYVSII